MLKGCRSLNGRLAAPISLDDHPSLRVGWFETEFPEPLGRCTPPPWLISLLDPAAESPMEPSEALTRAVRDMLRHGGYKPAGRGKPASEYLLKAASGGALGTINLAVDVCNAASLHSGLPMSVVDLHRAQPPFRIRLGRPGERYVFNAAGQQMELSGLVCLYDRDGPCANAVKDSQRTKTHDGTTRTLSLVWGCREYADRLREAVTWHRELLEKAGARATPSREAPPPES